MILWLGDPGPCPVCGAPHTTCTAYTGPIVVAQLPLRDAAASAPSPVSPPLMAERIQAALPPGQFTTGTYRRQKRGRK